MLFWKYKGGVECLTAEGEQILGANTRRTCQAFYADIVEAHYGYAKAGLSLAFG